MSTVYFGNDGEIELAVVSTMGVSVKIGDSPIGFFGTGLKFAIAVLLRTGHSITIWQGSKPHRLVASEKTIRGELFHIVCLEDALGHARELGFTTQLGRGWEVWQAYRELSCNATDEPGGTIGTTPISPAPGRTVIVVTGEGIARAHAERRAIFCEGRDVIVSAPDGDLLRGASRSVFYRGVRVWDTQGDLPVTINMRKTQQLTEDRTLKYTWDVPSVLSRLIVTCQDAEVVQAVLVSEHPVARQAQFRSVPHELVGEVFLDVCRRNRTNAHFSSSAVSLYADITRSGEGYDSVGLERREAEALDEARLIARMIEPDYLEDPPAVVVASLGPGVMGCVREGRVYIARSTLQQGPLRTASTLYEEYLHVHRQLTDESRTMQNYLLDRLASLAQWGADGHQALREMRRLLGAPEPASAPPPTPVRAAPDTTALF